MGAKKRKVIKPNYPKPKKQKSSSNSSDTVPADKNSLIVKVAGDGNCGYRALCVSYGLPEDMHNDLRLVLNAYAIANLEFFQDFY